MANLLSNTTIGGYQSIHTGNVGSYAITSIPTSFSSITVTSSFDTASNDIYASMRVIRNNSASNADGMYIGYGNSGSGITRIFGGGATGGALEKYATYTVEPGSFRAPIFYDSADTSYYLDLNSTSYLYHLVLSGNSYFRPNSWIEFNGNYGLYWPSNYGLHIYPNAGGSYGALQINGTKGGWAGIYFNDSGNTIMANSNESGFHRQGNGWQFRWTEGTMYVHRSNSGGGTAHTVLDTGNYNSFSIPTKQYVWSRGENLLTNGTGLLGNNTNFSSFTFDGSQAYFSSGSFRYTGQYNSPNTDELMPVNPEKRYRLDFWAKTANGQGAYYAYLNFFDVDGNSIMAPFHMYYANTLTTLAQTLNPGDTVAYLTSVANWENGGTAGVSTHIRSFIFWNYTNSFGYTYPPQTYSRNWYSDAWNPGAINSGNNTITLRVPWSGPSIAAGTQVSNGSAGGTFKYIALGYTIVPTTWTNYVGIMDGVDYSGTNAGGQFPPGTAAAKLGFLTDYNASGDTIYLANLFVGVDNDYPIYDRWTGNTRINKSGAFYGTIFYDSNNDGYYLDPNSTSNLYRVDAAAQMRAPIFYDSQDTNYYLDPNSTSRLNTVNANQISVYGNTYLGDGNGDEVHINDILRVGATDSGDAHFYFGEGGSAGSDYGSHWYWDSGYRFTWYTRNAGTDTTLFYYDTNSLSYITWGRSLSMNTNSIDYTGQLHFSAGTRFQGIDTHYLKFKTDDTSYGGIQVRDGNDTTRGYSGYFDSNGFGLLNSGGSWGIRLNPGSAETLLFYAGDWRLQTRSGGTQINGNLYTNTDYGHGLVGLYSASRYQGVFAMSDDYKLSADGTSTGNLYGLAWTHTNVGGQSKSGLEHQLLVMNYGVTQTAIGVGIWTAGLITTTSYGTSANWKAAYDWGNHASAGYLTSLPSHNHDDRYYTESEIDSQISNRLYQARVSGLNVNTFNATGIYRGSTSDWSNRPAFTHNGGALLTIDTHPGEYHSQLFFDTGGDRLYFRNANGGVWGSWLTMIHSGNIGSQSVSYASSAGNADTVDSLHASSFVRRDTTGQFLKPYEEYGSYISNSTLPNTLVSNMGGGGLRVDFLNSASFGSWAHTITFSGYNGYNMYQLAGHYKGSGGEGPDLYVRCEPNHAQNSWSSWQKLWHSGHFTDTNISNWNTAYGWGNHASAGYQSASTAITTSNIGSQSVSYASTAGALSSMNISQFTNNSGYITSSSLSSYLPLAGGTMSGQIYGPNIGTGTYDGLIQIRETGYVTTSQSAWGYAPGITYHWGGRVASKVGLRSDGLFAIDDEPFATRSWTNSQGFLTSINSTQVTNALGYTPYNSSNPNGYVTSSGSVNYATTAGSAPNGSNSNQFYDVNAGVGNGLRFWNGSSAYKISMGVGSLYQYGPVSDYSIKMQMNDGDTGRGFTWGRESYAPIAALNSTSGDMEIAGYMKSYGYRGNGNVGGTGTASWHPDGIYCGSTMWQYGSLYKNNTGIYGVSEMTMSSGPILSTYNTRNLIVRALDNNADVGILGQKSGGGFAFQIYGTGSSYGFLNGTWAAWDIRKAVNGAMYMNDNDSYYLQTNSTSNFVALNIQGNAVVHAGNIGSQSVSYAATAGSAPANGGNSSTVGGFGAGSFFRDLGFEGGGANANTIAETRSAFTYSSGSPWTGPLAYFGASGYGLQLNATYQSGVNISYRTRNGDNATWNSWREFIHSGNIGSQSVSYASSAGSVAWTNVSSRPTALSQFTNDLGNYGGFLTSITAHTHAISDVTGLQTALDSKQASLGFTPYNSTNPSGYITSSGSISGNAATATSAATVTGSSTINGYLTLSTNWGVSPYTSAFTIIGTYPSMTFRGSNGDTHYLIHMDSAGDIQYYFGPGYTTNNWTRRYEFSKSGNFTVLTGTISATNFSGTSSGTNTGDQTNISGNAATATNVAWTGVTSRPTALSQFSNDLGNYGGWITSSGSISGSAGSVSGLTLTSSANGINPDSVTQNQIGYNTSVSLFGQSDGGLYSSAYSSSWIHQIYGDFRTGQIAIRGKNSGSWQSWRTVLDSSNYTSYAPGLTGSGASGTWGINVTGSAGSVAWTNVSSRPTNLSQFTNDLGNYGGWQSASTAITTSNIGSQSVSYASTAGSAPANGGNSSTVGGYAVSGSVGANTVVIRDSNGYIYAHYINSNVSESENPTINSFYTSNGDGWLRKSSVAHVKSQLGLGSMAYESSGTYQTVSGAINTGNIGSQSVSYATTSQQLTKFGDIYGQDWNSYYINGKMIVSSVYGGSGPNFPTGAYNYGAMLSYGVTGSDFFQVYFPENGALQGGAFRKLHYRTGWNGSWSAWKSVVDQEGQVCTIAGSNQTGIEIHSNVGYNQDPLTYFLMRGQADTSWKALKVRLTGDAGGQDIEFRRIAENGTDSRMWYVPRGANTVNFDYPIVQPSDSRLKDNITPISTPVDKIKSLRGVEFDWNSGEQVGTHDVGLIAQDVEAVLPEAVTTQEDGYKNLAYIKVIPLLVEAMKEQQTMIEALRAEIELLKNK